MLKAVGVLGNQTSEHPTTNKQNFWPEVLLQPKLHRQHPVTSLANGRQRSLTLGVQVRVPGLSNVQASFCFLVGGARVCDPRTLDLKMIGSKAKCVCLGVA